MVRDGSGTLVIFVKQPRAGRAKTRLIPALGAEAAAQLAAAFLRDVLRRVSAELSAQTRIVLCYDPPDAQRYFYELQQSLALTPDVELLCQASGSLGERLAAALTAVGGPLVFIGTDAPDLPLSLIEAGLRDAAAGRAFIVKTSDGGYALLALPARTPETVFDEIAWSTADTARQQIERVRAADIDVVESDQIWWDVDEPADVLLLRRRLEANIHVAPGTLGVLRSFDARPPR